MKEGFSNFSDGNAYRISYLIAGYLRKTLTEEEHNELDAWVSANDNNMQLFEDLTDDANIEANLAWIAKINTEKTLSNVRQKLKSSPSELNRKRILWPLLVAAAIIVLVIGIFIFQQAPINKIGKPVQVAVSDALPGGNKATLTLSDGTVIDLEKKTTGLIQNEMGTKIEKKTEGMLMYEKLTDSRQINYNSLSVPRGGQYALTLSDGTKVWLNALSSLKFPEQFSDAERVVELTGEAFFNVSKDKLHPFIVRMANDEQVKVFGTQFNVYTYSDEDTKKVTLIEGSVQVSSKSNHLLLIPGQQARTHSEQLLLEKQADIEVALGWKNGEFVFRDADIYNIMRQTERWYDVNVIYRTATSEHFNFRIARNEPLSKILHLLELTGKIHFKIENKTVYVLP
jgi:transmembrane sensor